MTPTQESREEARMLLTKIQALHGEGLSMMDDNVSVPQLALALDAAKAKAWREGLRAGWARSSEMTNPYQSAPSDKEKAE